MPVIAQAPSGLRLVRSYAAFSRDGVALELLDDREQVVRDGRRLRALRVRVDGEDRVAMAIGEIEQRRGAASKRRGEQAEDELALPHPVHRHVDVVAQRAVCSRPATSSPHACDDQALDVEEQILAGAVVRDAADLVLRHARRAPRAARARRRRETMPCAASITRCA